MGRYAAVQLPSSLPMGSTSYAPPGYFQFSPVAAAAHDQYQHYHHHNQQFHQQPEEHKRQREQQQQQAFGEGLLYAWVQEQQLQGQPEQAQGQPEQAEEHIAAPRSCSLQASQLLEAPQGTAPNGCHHPQQPAPAGPEALPQQQALQQGQACSGCGGAQALELLEDGRTSDGEVLLIPSRSEHLHEMGARLLTSISPPDGHSFHAHQARFNPPMLMMGSTCDMTACSCKTHLGNQDPHTMCVTERRSCLCERAALPDSAAAGLTKMETLNTIQGKLASQALAETAIACPTLLQLACIDVSDVAAGWRQVQPDKQ